MATPTSQYRATGRYRSEEGRPYFSPVADITGSADPLKNSGIGPSDRIRKFIGVFLEYAKPRQF